MKEDEAGAHVVFLFPTFLTPEEYHKAWKQETRAAVCEVGGVFGGLPPGLDALANRLNPSSASEDPSTPSSNPQGTLDEDAADIRNWFQENHKVPLQQVLSDLRKSHLDRCRPEPQEMSMAMVTRMLSSQPSTPADCGAAEDKAAPDPCRDYVEGPSYATRSTSRILIPLS